MKTTSLELSRQLKDARIIMTDYELENLETRKHFKDRSSRRPLGHCEDCGKPIYQCDEDGIPFRICYVCSRST